MFGKGTLFVIGAGASCEVGLPAGNGLRNHIINALLPDNRHTRKAFTEQAVHDAVVEASKADNNVLWNDNVNHFREMAEKVREALPLAQSIDNYLDAHRGNETVETLGKIGIAHSILSAEKTSALKAKGKDLRSLMQPWNTKLLESWYVPFAQLLYADRPLDDVENLFENVSFIIFNYDRCIEDFLVRAITTYYQIDLGRAKEIIRKANIVHPYGKVGNLPWQGGLSVPLGGGDGYNLLQIAREIRTFTETVESGRVSEIKGMVADADTIVFMGFGFLEQNMRLLTPERGGRARRVFATTAGISDSDVEVVIGRIAEMLAKASSEFKEGHGDGSFNAYIERGYCGDLMKNHWLRLTRE